MIAKALAPSPEKTALVYHGLDFTRFPEPPARLEKTEGPYTLLSVGRLVPKKGYAGLIEALGRLPKDLDWRFRHTGGGPLKDALQAEAQQCDVATARQQLPKLMEVCAESSPWRNALESLQDVVEFRAAMRQELVT